MIPKKEYIKNIEVATIPSRTYCLRLDKKRIAGFYDNIESLKQSIYKMLITKRYAYEIYDWNYGIELDDLIGMPKAYIKIEIEKRIKDALSIDDRILKIYNFSYIDIGNDRCGLGVVFYIDTVFGIIKIDTEV